jgi:hypothetical protein
MQQNVFKYFILIVALLAINYTHAQILNNVDTLIELPNDNYAVSIDTTVPLQTKEILNQKHKALTVYKTNPFALLWGSIPFTSEFRLVREDVIAPQQSLQIGLSYLTKGPLIRLLEDAIKANNPGGLGNYKIVFNGFRFQASYKWYLNDLFNNIFNTDTHAPQGIYLAPHLSYSQAKFSLKLLAARQIYIDMIHFNTGLLWGIQLASRKGLAIDMYSGMGYRRNVWFEQNGPFNRQQIDLSNFGILLNGNFKFYAACNIGWSF